LMMNLRGVHDWLMTVISVLYVKRMMDIKRTVDVERMMDLMSNSFGLRANLHTVVSLMVLTTVISVSLMQVRFYDAKVIFPIRHQLPFLPSCRRCLITKTSGTDVFNGIVSSDKICLKRYNS
jgi:hypothetical protein